MTHPDLQTLLPVAADRDGKPLLTADGHPVWPLRDDDDRVALERLATVFGARLDRKRAEVGAARALSDEVVVALHPESEPAAILHAHLTRRRCRSVRDLEALKLTARPSVLVTTPAHLTHELLDWLYAENGESAPGIICGEAGAPLRRQVLVRAAAAALCGPLAHDRSDLYPVLPIEVMRDAGYEVLGAEAPMKERRAALSRGVGVLTIVTHSDGVDAFLGSDTTLCAMERPPADAGFATAPRCGMTGFCHRHGRTVREAIDSDLVFPPEKISARLFVWNVCFGLLPSKSLVDPRWSIGARLLESASIGAVLTSWQIVVGAAEAIGDVSTSITAGVPAGTALARFNASPSARAHGHRMCLLGDPRVRLPPRGGGDVDAPRANEPDPAEESSPELGQDDFEQMGEVALLRLCMAEAKQSSPPGPRAAVASKALDAIMAFEVAAFEGTPLADLDPRIGSDMRTSVLEYAVSRGKLVENWMPFARTLRPMVPSTCGVCGRRTDRLEAIMRPRGVRPRRVTICPLCGIMEDAPRDAALVMDLDGRKLHLHGALPRAKWTAGVHLGSALASESIHVPWPALGDGAMAPAIDLPERWPIGLLRISTIVLWDGTFAMLSLMARG